MGFWGFGAIDLKFDRLGRVNLTQRLNGRCGVVGGSKRPSASFHGRPILIE